MDIGTAQRLAAWTCTLGAAAVCAACTPSAPDPPPPTTAASTALRPTTAPSTTTSGSPTTNATDEQLAIMAVERFYSELNQAMITLSSKQFRTTYKPGCEACDQAANKIDSISLSGRRIQGGRFTLTNIRLTGRPTNTNLLKLEAIVTSEPISVRDAAGKIVESDPGDSGPKFFVVLRSDRGWLMSGMGDV